MTKLDLQPVLDIRPLGTVADPNDINEKKNFEEILQIADKNEVPIEIAERHYKKLKEENKKMESAYSRLPSTMLGHSIGLARPSTEKDYFVPELSFKKAAKEVPKGVARFVEEGIFGTVGGSLPNWVGQFVANTGYEIENLIGSDFVLNPLAQTIISAGEGISQYGQEARAYWAQQAATGWEAIDKDLKERDPVSYYAGKISEGLGSSILSVLTMYMSAGATAPATIADASIKINKGLALLSMISFAGSFEHAQSEGENFYWSTLHGFADAGIEYAMESSFLDEIKDSTRLVVGMKEGTEEIATGFFQNTRAGMLEYTNKGYSTYEASKRAMRDSLNQMPIEFVTGFLGGYGMASGMDLAALVQKSEQLSQQIGPVKVEPTPEGVRKAVEAAVEQKKAAETKATKQAEQAPEIKATELEKFGIIQLQKSKSLKGITDEEALNILRSKDKENAVKQILKNRGIDTEKIDIPVYDIRGTLSGAEETRPTIKGKKPSHQEAINLAVDEAMADITDVIDIQMPEYSKQQALQQPKAEAKQPPKVQDILGGIDPLQRIHESLRQAKEVQPLVEEEKKAERKRRVGAAAGAMKSSVKKGVPTEEAIFKSTGLLKGELTEYEQRYTSIEGVLEPEVKEAAYQQIYKHPDLRYFEIVNTATSFKKLLAGTALTPGDVKNIERVFGKQFKDITDIRQTKSDLYERILTWWKAMLLTGWKTSGLNILSTASHAMTETAKDIPTSVIDSGISLFTGERTTVFTLKGYGTGFKQGVEKGWKYLRTGLDERNVGEKYDYKKTNYGRSKIGRTQQGITEFIFHLLGAEDQPWYYGAFSRSLYSQSIAQGKTKGLKGRELKAFVNNLQQNPTDDMLIWAKEDADTAVFTNRTNLGDLGVQLQQIKPMGFLVPFSRTPSALAMQIINYSPVGVVKEIAHEIHNKQFDQRKFSQATGRTVVGIPAMYLGTQLFKAGLLALGYPKTEKERKLWELEGRKPNSILIGDEWRDIQALGPIGNLLIIGGYFQQALDSKGSPTEAMVEAMAGGGKAFTEQTFVRGVNLAVDALVDPEASFDRWFTSMAGSVVPTLVADIARAQDEIERRSVGPLERIQSRIPIYRKGLEPKIDVFGQDLPRYGGNVLEVMLDPTRPSKIRQDVVVDELRRLWDKNIKVSPTQLGDKKGYEILTDEENTTLWHRSGELTYKLLLAVVNSEAYQKADDFQKGKVIEAMTRQAKEAAKAEIVNIKLNQGKTIMELAESGLLNIESLEMLKYYRENQ